jgi:toxin ParE1/3/4
MTSGEKPEKTMANYRLSRKAEVDLLEIAVHGDREFGIAQSSKYREKLKKQLSALGDNPLHYPAVDHIRVDYRRSVCGVHSIYYKIGNDGISEIIRILRSQSTAKI